MSIAQGVMTLADPRHKITMTELRVLSDLAPDDAAQFWTAWQGVDLARRREIVGRLVELAEDNVDFDFAAVLQQCLHDADAAVRTRAAEGLWESDNPRTLRRLLPLLANDPSPEVRAAVAVTLGRFAYMAELGELNSSDEQALRAALIGCVGDGSQPDLVRRRALESAGYFGTSTSIEQAIEAAYGAGDPGMRESALIAMGRSMQERWLDTIGNNLRSPTASLRYQAARAAGEFADAGEALLPGLMPLLDDDDGEVTLAAIWALGQIGGPRAKRALEQVAKNGEEAQQQAANAALTELSLDDDPLGV